MRENCFIKMSLNICNCLQGLIFATFSKSVLHESMHFEDLQTDFSDKAHILSWLWDVTIQVLIEPTVSIPIAACVGLTMDFALLQSHSHFYSFSLSVSLHWKNSFHFIVYAFFYFQISRHTFFLIARVKNISVTTQKVHRILTRSLVVQVCFLKG